WSIWNSRRLQRDFSSDERQHAAPPNEDGDILLAIHGVGDGAGRYTTLRRDGPKFFSGRSAESLKTTVAGAFKHQIAGGRQSSAIPGAGPLRAPDFLLCHRVPGNQTASNTFQNRLLDLWILRQFCRDKVNAVVPSHGIVTEMFRCFVRKSRIEDWKIDQPRFRIVGHRLPCMRSAWTRRDKDWISARFILRAGRFDGTAGLRVNPRSPSHTCKRFRGQ